MPSTLDTLRGYDQFVDSSPQGILYCHGWWLDVVAPDQHTVLTVREGNELRAAWPITFQEVAGQRIIGMPPLTQKLGILFAPSAAKYAERLSEEHRLIEELIQQLPGDTYVTHHFHENFTNWLPFYWNQFQQTTRYTYVLPDLRDLDALWNALRKTARTTIRNADKHGLRVRETSDVEEVFRHYAQTMHRQGLPLPHTLEQFGRIDAACSKNAGRLALVAEDQQGRSHGGLYLAYDRRCAIYLLGGADPDLRQSGAQTVLLWEAIRFASRHSAKFDFEGSMIRGVEAALRDFGGIQTPYFRIWREPSRGEAVKTVAEWRRFAGRAFRKLTHIADPSLR